MSSRNTISAHVHAVVRYVLQEVAVYMQAVEEAESLRAELRRESLLRKRAHNELRELKGNIRVLCRVRPAAAGAVNMRHAGREAPEIAIRPHDEFTVLLDTVSKYELSVIALHVEFASDSWTSFVECKLA